MIAKRIFRSSVGRKGLVAVTGLILLLFLVGHMLGNWNQLIGQEAMNHYAATLKSMPGLLWTARIGLLLALIVHVVFAIQLNIENRLARPQKYVVNNKVQAPVASLTMVLTGVLILVFIVFHLMHFTAGIVEPDSFHLTDEKGRHDVYRMVLYGFSNPVFAITYIVAMFVVCFHLSHGVQSLFQSFGITNRHNRPAINKISWAIVVLLFAGLSIIPLLIVLKVITLP